MFTFDIQTDEGCLPEDTQEHASWICSSRRQPCFLLNNFSKGRSHNSSPKSSTYYIVCFGVLSMNLFICCICFTLALLDRPWFQSKPDKDLPIMPLVPLQKTDSFLCIYIDPVQKSTEEQLDGIFSRTEVKMHLY